MLGKDDKGREVRRDPPALAPSEPDAEAKRGGAPARAIAGLTHPLFLSLVALAPLFASLLSIPVVPTHDGPKNLYAAHVLTHLGAPGYATEYSSGGPVTALVFTALYGALQPVVGWRVAYALGIALGAALLPLGVFSIARAFDARRAPLALVGAAAAYPWASHMGFLHYVPSLGLGFVTLGVGLHSARWSPRRELAVLALLLLTTLCHPFGAQVAALGLITFRLANLQRGRVIRELGALALGCVPIGAVTLIANDALSDQGPQGAPLGLTAAERLESLTRWFLSGPLIRSAPAIALGAVGLTAAFATALDALRRRGPWDTRALALAGPITLGAAGTALVPMHAANWEYMQPRFVPLLVLSAAALVPLERLVGRARAASLALLTVYAASSNLWVADAHARIIARDAALYRALGATHPAPGRTLLPIIATPEILKRYQADRSRPIPNASFLFNVGQLFAVDREAVAPYSFTLLPRVHLAISKNVLLTRVPRRDYGELFTPAADPVRTEREVARLASYGTMFDDVLFYGPEKDAARMLAHGYVSEYRDEGLFIGHFVGCPGRVELRGPSDARGVVHVSWVGADRVVESIPFEAQLPRSVTVERGSCLGLTAIVAASNEAGTLTCAGGDADGLVAAPDASSPVVCSLVPAAPRPPPSPP